MELNGKELAEPIQKKLKEDIENLKQKGIIPKLAIVTLGPEEAWEAYVNQKIKLAKKLGVDIEFANLKKGNEKKLLTLIKKLNNDPTIHGIIVQRPMPASINKSMITNSILPIKDVDGFRDSSPYEVPVWLAVYFFISQALQVTNEAKLIKTLSNQSILVIGKGETAGMPSILGFKKLGLNVKVIDSKTKNVSDLIKKADVIISAVGKKVVREKDLKQGVILIGVGIRRDDKKLRGDYDEDEVKNIAKYYTPTPKGVGPINLSFLFKNLVLACKNSS